MKEPTFKGSGSIRYRSEKVLLKRLDTSLKDKVMNKIYTKVPT